MKLSQRERRAIERRKLARQIAELVLLQKTTVEIAAELGISVTQVRSIMKTDEYSSAWREIEASLSQDPRRQAARAEIHEMLPVAVRSLRAALEEDDVPWTVRLKAAEMILKITGLDHDGKGGSSAELISFLASRGIEINVVSQQDNRVQIVGTVSPELLRILKSPQELTQALGPQDVNRQVDDGEYRADGDEMASVVPLDHVVNEA
jgi:hypothetical protein